MAVFEIFILSGIWSIQYLNNFCFNSNFNFVFLIFLFFGILIISVLYRRIAALALFLCAFVTLVLHRVLCLYSHHMAGPVMVYLSPYMRSMTLGLITCLCGISSLSLFALNPFPKSRAKLIVNSLTFGGVNLWIFASMYPMHYNLVLMSSLLTLTGYAIGRLSTPDVTVAQECHDSEMEPLMSGVVEKISTDRDYPFIP